MTIAGDLQGIVTTAIVSALQKHNFLVVLSAPADAVAMLRVEMRSLEAKNIMGFRAGTLRDEFAIKGICKSAGGKDYEKFYNGLFETSIQFVPTGEANDRYVSAAVSDGLSQLVNDNDMLRCLAGE